MRSSPLPTIPFFISYLLPPTVIWCLFQRGWWAFAPVAVLLIGLPILDVLFGVANQWRESPDLPFNHYFRVVTWLWLPLQIVLLYWILDEVRIGAMTRRETIGAALSMGLVAGGIGIAVAHEFVHRRVLAERSLGLVLLTLVGYSHFAINHIHGHHRWVATPRDPSTARLNEGFYHFLPRAVIGGFASAWRIERERLRQHHYAALSPANRVLRGLLLEGLLCAGIFVWGGPMALAVFAGQAAVAIALVEAINYIEHYGLTRREAAPGEYSRVEAYHTWDSAAKVSNWLLLNLPRHADHHLTATKRYQGLELLPQAPRLPAGYGTMFLLALLPPLWFSVMNPRVTQAARLARP